ncbi:MAG: phosphoribosylamine--glycine ligase [Bdellovibrionales bacterium]|nr:phosphoribosylamine--glycine ligase [Bdellovibrionales bacterium]
MVHAGAGTGHCDRKPEGAHVTKSPGRKLKVLLVGSGAREHALAWKISQSPLLDQLFVYPGGDAWEAGFKRLEVPSGALWDRVAALSKDHDIDFLVVGPDNALSEGIVDEFKKVGIPAFGPTKAAARIESSKVFSKEVMKAAGVPTASYQAFSDSKAALRYLDSSDVQKWSGWVVKADGLALGKGVHVCRSLEDSRAAVETLMGISGRVLIEEFLEGEEVSWLAICDGLQASIFESARDYKRVGTGGRGGNTGGMGCYSPVQGHGVEWQDRLLKEVFEPVLAEMKKRGSPFTGVLYAGLMVNPKTGRYWVLEFNARFGDPEAQVLLPRMQDDVLEILWQASGGSGKSTKLSPKVRMKKEAAVYVVLAAHGYPEKPRKGDAIRVADSLSAPAYFLAGVTRQADGGLLTSGGRVLGALGMDSKLSKARAKAYQAAARVQFEGRHFREDIAGTAVVVFASGKGSNFEALMKATLDGRLSAQIVGLVTDQEDAKALEVAGRFGVDTKVIPAPKKDSGSQAERRSAHEKNILKAIAEWNPRFIALAGYMRILGPDLIRAFWDEKGYSRIVNIHPSLLPAFPGLEGYRQAYDHGCKVAGVTVHLVDETLDGGPICAQTGFSIEGFQSADQVRARGLEIEHGLYPETLNWIIQEKFEIKNRGARAYVANVHSN